MEAKCQSEVSTTCVRLLDATNGEPGNTKESWLPPLQDFHAFPVPSGMFKPLDLFEGGLCSVQITNLTGPDWDRGKLWRLM